MESVNTTELLARHEYEGIIVGIPTGMYADRSSYGNAPILIFILDKKLPCRAKTRPYSHRFKVEEGVEEIQEKGLLSKVFDAEFCDDNESLAIAATFIDQSIRESSDIKVQGKYIDDIFEIYALKVGNRSFVFEGYEFPFEKRAKKR